MWWEVNDNWNCFSWFGRKLIDCVFGLSRFIKFVYFVAIFIVFAKQKWKKWSLKQEMTSWSIKEKWLFKVRKWFISYSLDYLKKQQIECMHRMSTDNVFVWFSLFFSVKWLKKKLKAISPFYHTKESFFSTHFVLSVLKLCVDKMFNVDVLNRQGKCLYINYWWNKCN